MSLVLGVHCTVSVIRWKTIELTKCDTHFVARPEQNKKTVKNLYSYVFVLFFCLLTLFLCLQFRRLQFLVCTLSTFHSYVLSTSTWDVCPANCKRVAVHTAYSCVSANMLKLCNYSFAPLSLSLSPAPFLAFHFNRYNVIKLTREFKKCMHYANVAKVE